MTLLAITSIIRNDQGYDEGLGRVVIFDFEKSRVIQEKNIPPAGVSGRGAVRGVDFSGDAIAVANEDTVFIYEAATGREVRRITNNLTGGIHEIRFGVVGGKKILFVTCAKNDLVLAFDIENGSLWDAYCWREDKEIVKTLGLDPDEVHSPDLGLDYREDGISDSIGHLNSVRVLSDGRIGFFLGRLATMECYLRCRDKGYSYPQSAAECSVAILACNADATGIEILYRGTGGEVPAHGFVEHGPGRYGWLHTTSGKYVSVDDAGGKITDLASSTEIPFQAFLRGMDIAKDGRVFVGRQKPFGVYCLTPSGDGEMKKRLVNISGHKNESVMSIRVIKS
jgi:hypothetical protein